MRARQISAVPGWHFSVFAKRELGLHYTRTASITLCGICVGTVGYHEKIFLFVASSVLL
jgi:hypothetical protein